MRWRQTGDLTFIARVSGGAIIRYGAPVQALAIDDAQNIAWQRPPTSMVFVPFACTVPSFDEWVEDQVQEFKKGQRE